MTAEIIINKAVVTDEAVFDYMALTGKPLQTLVLKRECEEYIAYMQKAGRLNGYYFRTKYYDENLDRMLMLFFYKGKRLRMIQIWNLCGVCYADDWSQELEESGAVRVWLKTKIAELPQEDDWAVEVRVKHILQTTQKTLFENILKEIEDAFKCFGDKETAKEMAFLQSHYFEHGKRPALKKAKRNRKCNKRT